MASAQPTQPSNAGVVAPGLLSLATSLDLDTKVKLLTGAAAFTLHPEPSIGLGELRLSDGPTGVRGLKFSGGRVVALFPNATLLSSAWSEDVAFEVGQILAEEAMAQQIHVVLGPTINLHRTTLGGRLFEQFSEDPLLTGRIAAAYVRGLQGYGVAACLKHLVANEAETERNTVNNVVDETTLRELYLLPFEIAVEDADAWSIMAAYNDVNGVAATEQEHVNNEIVKGEWGYRGLIMSDWFATKTVAPAANGGLDLVMPGPGGPWGDNLVAAVRAGEVAESVIDDHLTRLLLLAERTGALGTARDYPADLPAPDSAVRKEQLRRLAASGMTVLTNRDRTLPLRTGQRMALIGRPAIETTNMGGGSAGVNAPYQVSIADGMTALFGDSLQVVDGVEVRNRPVPARPDFVTDPHTGRPGVGFTLLAEDGAVLEERHSAAGKAMVGFDDDFEGVVHRVRVRARVDVDGPIDVGVMGAGAWEVRAAGEVLRWQVALAGTGVGESVINPPTQTTELTVSRGDVIDATVDIRSGAVDDDPMVGIGLYGLIARRSPRDDDEVIAEAVAAARSADVAVVVVGCTDEQETEAVDKDTLHLPGRQDELVRAVAAVAPRTVVVVNAATPALMPWIDSVDAILWAGIPGQEGGHAVAAALLGEIEPAGRLVTTFPSADDAAPAWSVKPAGGVVDYVEGTFIGYRGHYAGRAPAPAFWFGHGLGYSTWDYSPAALTGASSLSVTVTNTGERTSREVVQVYFEPAASEQPVRLVGWTAVEVAAGASADVVVDCDRRLWRRWDDVASTWDVLPDEGRLLVARGLGDIRATFDL
ncbi:MAG: glycoside hydrolase family 3 C-terminal domain-containing protein [Mycobacteriales bacterium]